MRSNTRANVNTTAAVRPTPILDAISAPNLAAATQLTLNRSNDAILIG